MEHVSMLVNGASCSMARRGSLTSKMEILQLLLSAISTRDVVQMCVDGDAGVCMYVYDYTYNSEHFAYG